MRSRIRLVSDAVLLCMGLLADTVWTQVHFGLGRSREIRAYGYAERCAYFAGVLAF